MGEASPPLPPLPFQRSTPPATPTASSRPLQGLQAREETSRSLGWPRREAEGGGEGTREGEEEAPAAAAPPVAAAAAVLEGRGATSKTSTPLREASATARVGLCLCQAIGGGAEGRRDDGDGGEDDEEERASRNAASARAARGGRSEGDEAAAAAAADPPLLLLPLLLAGSPWRSCC